jgi:hypothetical protein
MGTSGDTLKNWIQEDKGWIKFFLVAAFIISLVYVFYYSWRTLQDAPSLDVNVQAPAPPKLIDIPTLQVNPTPGQVEAYLKKAQQAVEIDKQAVDIYVQQVAAYGKEVEARITAAKAKTRDSSARLLAFEKVIKDTFGPLIVTPLLAALLIYSGIKIGGDVAMAKVTGAREKHVTAP